MHTDFWSHTILISCYLSQGWKGCVPFQNLHPRPGTKCFHPWCGLYTESSIEQFFLLDLHGIKLQILNWKWFWKMPGNDGLIERYRVSHNQHTLTTSEKEQLSNREGQIMRPWILTTNFDASQSVGDLKSYHSQGDQHSILVIQKAFPLNRG